MAVKILIGADPEIPVSRDGKLVSAHGMIPGNKKEPYAVKSGAVQVDGMLLEFNINPATSEEEFLYNVRDVMGELEGMIGNHKLEVIPVAEFGEQLIAEQPDEAKELGCDPDFNAWESKENIPPNAELPYRTAAGHLHIGWTEGANTKDVGFLTMVEGFVKQLDFFLGLPSLMYDKDVKRREMYGKAGCYRPKSYGVEYRTLSNQWLKSEGTMRLMYRNIHTAMQNMFDGNRLFEKYGDIQHIINNSNVEEGKAIMDREGITYAV